MRNLFFFGLLLLLPAFTFAATVVNINTADATLLDTLPGVGPSKATAIVDYRVTNGAFIKIEDIEKVKGIGPSTYAGLKDFISVSGASTVAQPTAPKKSSNTKQAKVVPAGYTQTSFAVTQISEPAHVDESIIAPTATSELAAVGAPARSRFAELIRSPWTLGFFALIALAGGMLLIL